MCQITHTRERNFQKKARYEFRSNSEKCESRSLVRDAAARKRDGEASARVAELVGRERREQRAAHDARARPVHRSRPLCDVLRGEVLSRICKAYERKRTQRKATRDPRWSRTRPVLSNVRVASQERLEWVFELLEKSFGDAESRAAFFAAPRLRRDERQWIL